MPPAKTKTRSFSPNLTFNTAQHARGASFWETQKSDPRDAKILQNPEINPQLMAHNSLCPRCCMPQVMGEPEPLMLNSAPQLQLHGPHGPHGPGALHGPGRDVMAVLEKQMGVEQMMRCVHCTRVAPAAPHRGGVR
jgi:hypothetical protein